MHLQFHVGHGINPPEPVVHKGGSIHFELTSKPEGSGGGLWSSEDERVLRYAPCRRSVIR